MKRRRIDDDIQPAKVLHRFRHCRRTASALSDIALLHLQTQSTRLGVARQFFVRGRFDPACQNIGAARRKALRDGASNAGGPVQSRLCLQNLS